MGVWRGAVAFSDVNNDGFSDILITGDSGTNEPIAKLYNNDGLGNFTEMTNTPFIDALYSSISFADVNGDGNEDVLISGGDIASKRTSKLYINDGMGKFTELMNTPFNGVWRGSVVLSDVNNDGFSDVFITGRNPSNIKIAELCINNGN